jgi:hypothetical protein
MLYKNHSHISLQDEGEENPGFVEDEEPAREEECEDFEEDPKFKKILETISENQNSPYSTQASHNNSRYTTTPPGAATTIPGTSPLTPHRPVTTTPGIQPLPQQTQQFQVQRL